MLQLFKRLPVSVRHQWALPSLLGVFLSSLPAVREHPLLGWALLAAGCLALQLWLRRMASVQLGPAHPDLSALASKIAGEEVRVYVNRTFQPNSLPGKVFLPADPRINPSLRPAFLHEIGHVKGKHFQVVNLLMPIFAALIPMLVHASGLIWFLLTLVSLSGTFVLWVGFHWFSELVADHFSLILALRTSFTSRSEIVERRRAAHGGFSFTHPPRALRVWVVS